MKPMTSFVLLLQPQRRKNKMIFAMLIVQQQTVTTPLSNVALPQLETSGQHLNYAQPIADLVAVMKPMTSFVLVLILLRRKNKTIFVI
jgi:hypothetical protein